MSQIDTTLVLGLVGLVVGLAALLGWASSAAQEDEAPCQRCGGLARLVEERLEGQAPAIMTVIERFECRSCGHEHLRLTSDSNGVD